MEDDQGSALKNDEALVKTTLAIIRFGTLFEFREKYICARLNPKQNGSVGERVKFFMVLVVSVRKIVTTPGIISVHTDPRSLSCSDKME